MLEIILKFFSVCYSIGTIYEDVTTEVLGKIGNWQWLVTFISAVLMVPALFNQYEDVFMLYPVDVVCIPPQGVTILNSSLCSITVQANGTEQTVKCNKWQVKLVWLVWLKKSWLLFCDQQHKLLSTAIICRFGLVFGCVIFGSLSDSFGRKPAIFIGIFTSLGFELSLIFCDSQSWFRLFVFLKAVFESASMFMGLLLICEIASNSWRSTLTTIAMTPRLFATVCTVPLANSASNVETFSFIACLISSICIVIIRWCPESPQWLLYNRKIHVAETTLKKAAKMNGITLCRDFKIRPVNHKAYNSLDETTTCVGGLMTPNIRTIFLVTSSFWAAYYFLWSSIYVRVYSNERSGNLLLKIFCFVGIFGCLTVTASKKLTLRYLLMSHIVLTGVSTISVLFIRKGMVRIVASSIAISAGIIVHALVLNMTPRLFATNIRGSTFGCCHASGQLGSTISYILFLFQPMSEITIVVVVVGITIVLLVLCLILPNVDGRELPDVIVDMDYYSELSKPLRWATQKTNSVSTEEIEMKVYSFGSGPVIPTRSLSSAKIPARRIGFLSIRRSIVEYLRRKFMATLTFSPPSYPKRDVPLYANVNFYSSQ